MEQNKVFTLEEARSLLPWLREASEEAEHKVLEAQQRAKNPEEAQAKTTRIIQYWADTIYKLGALPKQPFTVDFDSGSDYFCWEYPEDDIFYRHDYHLGYAGRHRIVE